MIWEMLQLLIEPPIARIVPTVFSWSDHLIVVRKCSLAWGEFVPILLEQANAKIGPYQASDSNTSRRARASRSLLLLQRRKKTKW